MTDRYDTSFDIPCRGCGEMSPYVYCSTECSERARCPHGNKPGDCGACETEADLAYDAAREDRDR